MDKTLLIRCRDRLVNYRRWMESPDCNVLKIEIDATERLIKELNELLKPYWKEQIDETLRNSAQKFDTAVNEAKNRAKSVGLDMSFKDIIKEPYIVKLRKQTNTFEYLEYICERLKRANEIFKDLKELPYIPEDLVNEGINVTEA